MVLRPATGDDSVLTDDNLMRTILNNLVENAVKYSDAGSTIAVEVKMTAAQALICCVDEGVGISQKDLPYIFESLYRGGNTVSVAGTGLGLHTVWHYVQALGGEVSVDSTPGEGTCVNVRLQRVPSSEATLNCEDTAP